MQQEKPATTRMACSTFGLEAEFAARRRGLCVGLGVGGSLGTPPQQQRDRRHGQGSEHADADMGGAPALGRLEMFDDERPHGAGEIAARGRECDGKPPVLSKPMGEVGYQRREPRRRAEPDDQGDGGELPDVGGEGAGDVAEREQACSDQHWSDKPHPVDQASHQEAADGKADHRAGVGQRCAAAHRAELQLQGRQKDDDRPVADARDRAENQRQDEPPPRIAGVDLAGDGRGLHVRRHGQIPWGCSEGIETIRQFD